MKFTVVPVVTTEQRDAFVALLETTGLYSHGEGARRYSWFYKDSQSRAFLLLNEIGEPVGVKGYRTRKFTYNGEHFMGAMSVDFAMLPEYRKLKPALQLYKTTTEQILEGVDFVYSIPNSNSTSIYKRSKLAIPFAPFQRYVKILSAAELIKSKIHTPVSATWNVLNKWHLLGISKESKVYDKLIPCDNATSFLSGDHSFDYLTWRYTNYPFLQYEVFAVDAGEHGTAMIVSLTNGSKVYIIDIICSVETDILLKTVFVKFEQYCIKSKKTAIILCVIGATKVEQIVQNLWYKKISHHPTKTLWLTYNTEHMKPYLLNKETVFWCLGDEDAN